MPDYGHTFVTAGFGILSPTTTDYVGAVIDEGTLGMAYCPKAVTITVNMSKFSGKVMARWYDPTDGSFRNVQGSPFRNSGSIPFSTPGKNRAGDEDWVLVMETRPAG